MRACIVAYDVPDSMEGMLCVPAGTRLLARPCADDTQWFEAHEPFDGGRTGFVPASHIRTEGSPAITTTSDEWGAAREREHARQRAAHADTEAQQCAALANHSPSPSVAVAAALVLYPTVAPATPYRRVSQPILPRIAAAAGVPRDEHHAARREFIPWYLRSARRGEHILKARTHITGRDRRIKQLMSGKVQRQWRRVAAVRYLARLRAAIRVAAVRRGIVARRRVAARATARLEEWGSRTLQRLWHDRDVFADRAMLRRRAERSRAGASESNRRFSALKQRRWDADGTPAHSHRPAALRVKPAYPPRPLICSLDGKPHALGPWRRDESAAEEHYE